MSREKVFNKQIKVSTILSQIGGYGWLRPNIVESVSEERLIKEWWYSRLANAYVRYWSICPYTTTNERITLNQVGGEDYRIALQQVLENRQIFNEADNSYRIDFAAIQADIRQKKERNKSD